FARGDLVQRRLRFEIAGIDAADSAVEIGGGAVTTLVGEDAGERLERDHVLAIQRDRALELCAGLGQASRRQVAAAEHDVIANPRSRTAASLLAEQDRLIDPA